MAMIAKIAVLYIKSGEYLHTEKLNYLGFIYHRYIISSAFYSIVIY